MLGSILFYAFLVFFYYFIKWLGEKSSVIGICLSMVFVILGVFMNTRTGADQEFGSCSQKRQESNPLYRKGHFRKKKDGNMISIFSDLKLLFWSEIAGLGVIGLWGLYGILSSFTNLSRSILYMIQNVLFYTSIVICVVNKGGLLYYSYVFKWENEQYVQKKMLEKTRGFRMEFSRGIVLVTCGGIWTLVYVLTLADAYSIALLWEILPGVFLAALGGWMIESHLRKNQYLAGEKTSIMAQSGRDARSDGRTAAGKCQVSKGRKSFLVQIVMGILLLLFLVGIFAEGLQENSIVKAERAFGIHGIFPLFLYFYVWIFSKDIFRENGRRPRKRWRQYVGFPEISCGLMLLSGYFYVKMVYVMGNMTNWYGVSLLCLVLAILLAGGFLRKLPAPRRNYRSIVLLSAGVFLWCCPMVHSFLYAAGGPSREYEAQIVATDTEKRENRDRNYFLTLQLSDGSTYRMQVSQYSYYCNYLEPSLKITERNTILGVHFINYQDGKKAEAGGEGASFYSGISDAVEKRTGI